VTSPYSYQNVLTNQAAESKARGLANYYESLRRKKAKVPYDLAGAAYRASVAAKTAKTNYDAYYNNWLKANRPGALEALQAKYTNKDDVLNKILPFDEQSALARINTKRTYDTNLIGIGNQRNQLNQDYNTQRHIYDQNVPIMARQLLNNYGARGMANSSGYGQAVGNQQADLANQLASLDSSKQVGLANLSSQEGQLNAGYQNDLGSILYNAVQNLTTKAGSLGLTKNKGLDIYNDPALLIQLAQKMLAGG
jgi:hypothetical protein